MGSVMLFNGKVDPTKCQNSVRERVWCIRLLFGPFAPQAALLCVTVCLPGPPSRSRQKSSMPPTTAENGRHPSAKRRRRGERQARLRERAGDEHLHTATLSYPPGFLVCRWTDGAGGGR